MRFEVTQVLDAIERHLTTDSALAQAVVDLGQVAKRNGLKQTGVRNLAGIFLGTRIPKGAKTTNWAARRLTPQQITYAATDAWVCRELYLRFAQLELI